MPKELIKTTTEVVPYEDAAYYVWNQYQKTPASIAESIALVGLAAVTLYFAKSWAPRLIEALSLAGIAAGVGEIVDTLTGSYNKKLGDALKQMKTNQKLRIITRTYNNYSGSGNSWWISHEFDITPIN